MDDHVTVHMRQQNDALELIIKAQLDSLLPPPNLLPTAVAAPLTLSLTLICLSMNDSSSTNSFRNMAAPLIGSAAKQDQTLPPPSPISYHNSTTNVHPDTSTLPNTLFAILKVLVISGSNYLAATTLKLNPSSNFW